jgi:hypothetical protein
MAGFKWAPLTDSTTEAAAEMAMPHTMAICQRPLWAPVSTEA